MIFKKTVAINVAFLLCSAGMSLADTSSTCAVDPNWFSSPSMPTEIKKSGGDGTSTTCDFYQFSWQAFAYLMAKSDGAAKRNFLDTSKYYELEVNADGSVANSCDDKKDGERLFVKSVKNNNGSTQIIIPEQINQAGAGATIYDQKGNVVYYDVRFSKNMCDIKKIESSNNFPGGTVELKGAWKVMDGSDDVNEYLTVDATIVFPHEENGKKEEKVTLGLVGFHVAVATPDHPEFIWATYEHKRNAPNCFQAQPIPQGGWAFASTKCAEKLMKCNENNSSDSECRFNEASKQSKLAGGTPTEICRQFPYGSPSGNLPHKNENENVQVIKALNKGVQPYLKDSFAVLKNYFNVGALWVNDVEKKSSHDNQRGSLQLSNTVAETTYQTTLNCFDCHRYHGKDGNNTTKGDLSHIFNYIKEGEEKK